MPKTAKSVVQLSFFENKKKYILKNIILPHTIHPHTDCAEKNIKLIILLWKIFFVYE